LAGYRVYASRECGTKWSRALPVASQVAAGNVSVRNGAWNQAFFDELRAFPSGEKDDQVDALSRAMITMSELPESGRRLFVPFNSR
jgi:predicted phage terminase large subunit-like protein